MSYWAENWSAWVGAFLVLAIYTYLWKDNPLYRITMQIFIGVNVGYNVVIQWRDILYPQWYIPMLDGFQALFFGGTGSPWGALWIVAGLLGLFWYFQMSRKLLWLSRIVMGVIIGITAGVTIKSQLGTNLPQLTDSFRPLSPSIGALQPRRLFDLPASEVAPAIDANLGFFESRGSLVCVETLGGLEMWRQPAKASAPLSRVGDFLSVDGRAYSVSTGLPSSSAAPVRTGVEYSDVDRHLMISPSGDGISAVSVVDGKLAWHLAAPTVTGLGLARATLVYVDGISLDTVDVLTGKVLGRFALPGKPVGGPIVAAFSDQLENAEYAVVPLEGNQLVAIQISTNPGFNRLGGEILWSFAAPFPVVYGTSIDGQLFVSGPKGGAVFELPRPSKRLLWTDYLDNWVFFLTLVSVMTYFFFSFRLKSAVVEKTSVLGRYMLMIGFGAFFGNTVMTRMSYLIDRLMFLVDEWLKPFIHHFF